MGGVYTVFIKSADPIKVQKEEDATTVFYRGGHWACIKIKQNKPVQKSKFCRSKSPALSLSLSTGRLTATSPSPPLSGRRCSIVNFPPAIAILGEGDRRGGCGSGWGAVWARAVCPSDHQVNFFTSILGIPWFSTIIVCTSFISVLLCFSGALWRRTGLGALLPLSGGHWLWSAGEVFSKNVNIFIFFYYRFMHD